MRCIPHQRIRAVTHDITSQFAITRSGLVLESERPTRSTRRSPSRTRRARRSSRRSLLSSADFRARSRWPTRPARPPTGSRTSVRCRRRDPAARGHAVLRAQVRQSAARDVHQRPADPLYRRGAAECAEPDQRGGDRGTTRVLGRAGGWRGEPDDHAADVDRVEPACWGRWSAARLAAPITATTDGSGYFGASVAGVNPGAFVAVQVDLPGAEPSVLVPGQLPRQRFLAQGVPARRIGADGAGFHRCPGQGPLVQVRGHAGSADRHQAERAAGGLRSRGVQGHRPGVREPVQSGDGGAVGSPQAHGRVRAVDVQSVDVLAVDVQPVDVQSGRVQPVDLQSVDVLARRCSARRRSRRRRSARRPSARRRSRPSTFSSVDLQPVDVQSVDVLAVHRSARPRSRRRSRPRRREASSRSRPPRA